MFSVASLLAGATLVPLTATIVLSRYAGEQQLAACGPQPGGVRSGGLACRRVDRDEN